MVSKIIQYTGIFLIISFCVVSIFITSVEREIPANNSFKETIKYAPYFEERFYDFRMRQTIDPNKIESRIVLGEIDDKSLSPEHIGRWPWNRDIWAEILSKLNHFGAKIIAFDVFFSEPQQFCDKDYDSLFANAIGEYQSTPDNHIILPYKVSMIHDGQISDPFFEEMPEILYNHIMVSQLPSGSDINESKVSKYVFPIEKVLVQEPRVGHIQSEQDADGIFRHYWTVANIDQIYFPSFGLLAYQLYTGDNISLVQGDYLDWIIKTEKGNLPVNKRGESKIRWFGGQGNFPSISLWDIYKADLEDTKMRQVLNGNMVFIGSTAFGAHDLRHTPLDPSMPGVFFHMNFTKMLLDGKFLKPPSESAKLTWIILTLTTLIMILVMLLNNALFDLMTVAGLSFGMYFYDTFYLLPDGYQIKLFFSLLSVISVYSWSTFLNFYITNKEKKQIKGTFSSFVAPTVVEEMLANPDQVKVGGEKKNITVFFSDVRDFTSISEKLTPEELSQCLNQYMGVMTDILFKSHGTLDKYIGDAIVAFWGAPLKVENHAYHAVKASIEMIEVLPSINDSFREQGFPEFKHGIGLNTGDCSVGNMGSDSIFQYTALGDSMNLGARLESLCKYYGVQLNISEYTKDAIPEDLQKEFKFRILDKVRVKGKEEAVTIYEVLHPSHKFYQDDQALTDYLEAFDLYLSKKFQDAADLLKPLTEKYPEDKSCNRVLEFAEGYIQNPPPADWDGVYTHTTKG